MCKTNKNVDCNYKLIIYVLKIYLLGAKNMKGHIFNDPYYTKTDWHTGKTILSRNGQKKGLNVSGAKGEIRRGLAQVASSQVYDNPRARAPITVNGKKMILANSIVGKALAGRTFGGAENREAARRARHERTLAMLSGNVASSFRSSIGGGPASPDFGEYYP